MKGVKQLLEPIRYYIVYKPYIPHIHIKTNSGRNFVYSIGIPFYNEFVELCEADAGTRNNLCLLYCHDGYGIRGEVCRTYLNDPQSVKWYIRHKSNKSRTRI